MSRDKRLIAGVGLIGTGASILGFGAAESVLSALPFPHWVYAGAAYLGAALFLLGVVLTGTYWKPPGLPQVTYEFRAIRRSELRSQLQLVKELLGAAPPLRALKDIYNANPKCIWLAEKVSTYQSGSKSIKVVGFFSLVPLNKAAVALLEEERLDGLRFNSEHISAPNQKPAGLYVGSIVIKGMFRARAEILGYVRSRIDEALETGVPWVFTRPITRDGLRLAKRHGFQPVADDCGDDDLKRIYRRENLGLASEPPNQGPAASG